MADRSIRVRLIADVQSYRAAMASAGAATKDFGRELSGQGSATSAQMEKVGKSALLMAGVIGAGLGLSVKAALDWESAWAGVTKTVDGSASEMAQLEEGLRGLATSLPATHGEIAAVAEAAGQLGIQRGAIIGFTETMVALGETTNLTADEAATSMARMANIMQTPQGEIDRLGASLVALGNDGASTEREILDMAMRIASAGTQIGLTEGEVLGFANALSSVGIEAEAGGSAISRVMIDARNAVMDGGEALDTFAETAGMSSAEFSRAFREDAGGALISFIEGLGRMEEQGLNSNTVLAELGLTDIRVGNALRSAAASGDLFRESLALGNDAFEENTALNEEAEKRYKTTAAQLEVFRNKVVDLGIDIGGQLLPVLSGMTDLASGLVDGFSALPDPVKQAATGLAVLATVGLGTIGMIGTLAPKIAAGREALEAMGSAGQTASRGLGAFGRGVGRLAPAAGVVAGLLLLREALGTVADEAERADLSVLENELLDLADSGEFAGETLQRLVDGLGSGDPSKAAAQFKTDMEQIDEALASLAGRDPEAAAAVYDHIIGKLRETGASAGEAARWFDAYQGALASADTGQRTAGDAAGELNVGLEPIPGSAEAAKDALDAFNDEIDRLLGGAFSFQEASDALEQGIIDAGTHFAEQAENFGTAGLALEGNSQAALDNREVMRGLIEQGADVIRAGREQGMSIDELNGIRETEKAKLRELADRYGLNQGVVDGYIAVLDGIPISKSTTIAVNDEASWTIEQIQARLAALPASKTISISTIMRDSAAQQAWNESRGRWGMVTSYASGGIEAHVGHGDIIRYAEPETGGEAFIPRIGDAARSKKILETAASWYGLTVVPAGGWGQMMAPRTPAPTAPVSSGSGSTTIEKLVLQTPDSPRQWLDEASWRTAPA